MWNVPNLVFSFRLYFKISKKIISWGVFLGFSNIFKVIFQLHIYVWQFLHPKNYPKIIISLWKRYGITQSYFGRLKYMSRFLAKLLVKLFFSNLLLYLELCLVLAVSSSQRYPQIVTGLLNGSDIVWIWLCPLDYISRFPTELLVKVGFWDFRIF